METTQNSAKFCTVLEKKPRASSSSKRVKVGGLDLFFKSSQALTGGSIMIFHDSPPYPYIKFIAVCCLNQKWQTLKEVSEIAYEWCIKNYDEIVKRLKSLDSYIKINEDMWRNKDEEISRKPRESKSGQDSM